VNHLAEQVNSLIRIFFNGFIADFNRILYTVAKAEMPRQVKLNRSEIKMCG